MTINLASRLSAITTDFTGVSHIVWVEDNAIWHAQFNANAGIWANAQRVVEGVTGNVTALNLLASPKLIAGSSPGLAVIWQDGVVSKNASNFYYSAAQYGANGQMQWDAAPTAITVNETRPKNGLPFANLAPQAIVDNDGSISIIGQQVNVLNAVNQSVREDTDLYTSNFTILSVTPAPFTGGQGAFYEPPVVVNGVNQGPGTPVNPAPSPPPSARTVPINPAPLMAQATEASTTSELASSTISASSTAEYQGIGFDFGGTVSFDTDLITSLGLKKYLFGIPRLSVEKALKRYQMVGTLSGGMSPKNSLQLFSQGSAIRNNTMRWWAPDKVTGRPGLTDRKRTGVAISFSYESESTYENISPFYLTSIYDALSLTVQDTFPLFEKKEGLVAGSITLTGSFGIGAQLTLAPNTPSDSDTILQLALSDIAAELSSSLLTVFAANTLGGGGLNEIASSLIASGVFEPIESVLLGNLIDKNNLKVTKFLVGPTFSAILNGETYLGFLPFAKLNTSGGLTLQFTGEEDGQSGTNQLGIPLSAGLSIGPFQFNLSIDPTWNWSSNPPPPNNTQTTTTAALSPSSLALPISEAAMLVQEGVAASSTTDLPAASVQGSLLTLNFDAPLNTSSIPDPSLFSIQITPEISTATQATVAGVLVSNDPSTGNGVVVLQLSQPIAYSPQFTGTNPQPAVPTEAAVTVGYTKSNADTNLEYSSGDDVASFSDVSVTNNSPQNMAVLFNPTTGTGQDYSVGSGQQSLLGSLEADYAQDSPPALAMTSTNQAVAVWSREVQPLTPIAGFVNGNTVYLNFIQDLNPPKPSKSQFSILPQISQSFDPSVDATITPALLTDGDTLYLASVGLDGTSISLIYSNDAGQTWESTGNDLVLPSALTTSQAPALVLFSGKLFLAFVDNNQQIHIASSSDSGSTWSDPTAIGLTSGCGVTLVEYQDQLMAFFVDAQDSHILYSYYSQSAWSESYRVATSAGTFLTASGPISSSMLGDTLYLSYLGGEAASPASTYSVTSTSDENLTTLSWQTSELTAAINANSAPSLANDDTQLYLTYTDNNQSLNYLISADGTHWSDPQAISDQTATIQTSNNAPSSAILDGVLYLAYTSEDANQGENIKVMGLGTVVTNIDIGTGGYIQLTLSGNVGSSDTVTIAYQPNFTAADNNLSLTDAIGAQLWIPAFNEALTNTSSQDSSAAPSLLGGATVINNDTLSDSPNTLVNNIITLIFDSQLNTSQVPNASAFTILVNGQALSPNIISSTDVSISGNAVTLTLPYSTNTLISQGNTVSVTYTVPTSSDQQLAGTNGTTVGNATTQLTTLPETPTTTLMARVFSTQGKPLTSPLQNIIGSDGLNFDPAVASDNNGNALAVWVYAEADDVDYLSTPGQYYNDNQAQLVVDNLSQSDIYFSYWNGSQWTIAAPLVINQPGTDTRVTIGYIEPSTSSSPSSGQYIAAWLNTQTNSSTGLDEVTLYWSLYDPNTNVWQAPAALLSEAAPDPLTNLVLSTVHGKPTLFWTETQPVSYSQLTLEANPSVYLRLAERSGTTATNSGNLGTTANGVYSGPVTLSTAGALFNPTNNTGDPNPAALFANQASVTVNSAINPGGSAFSVEFWFKIPAAVSAATTLVALEGVFNIAVNVDGTLSFSLSNSEATTITTDPSKNSIELDTWYYVVGTYSNQPQSDTKISQPLSLYLNGALINTVAGVNFSLPATASLTLAGGIDAVYLDEVAIYDTAISFSSPSTTQTVNSLDFINELFDTDQIGDKYSAQYVSPLPPGPQLQASSLVSETLPPSWSSKSLINPLPLAVPTTLSDANAPKVDVVSNAAANFQGNISPNGKEDTIFRAQLTGLQGKTISNLLLTLSNGMTYGVGFQKPGAPTTNQLAVVVGNSLINSTAPNAAFNYAIMGSSLTLDLLVDTGSAPNPNLVATSIKLTFSDNTGASSQPGEAYTINLPLYVPPNSVPVTPGNAPALSTATVTEIEDSSLTLIDSGLIIDTTNPGMGYAVASADFNQDGRSDVAIGNRGYTNSSGQAVNGGTVQVLMGGKSPLNGNTGTQLSPPGTQDLSASTSGNPNGFAIVGIPDQGLANGDVPFCLATGDLDNDKYADLIIGSPNNNSVYIIYGSYLATNPQASVIDVGTLSSNPKIGLQIKTPDGIQTGDNFGFAITVGNFDSSAGQDIVIGAPSAKGGSGEVWVVYNPTSQQAVVELVYTGLSGEQAGYALATSAFVPNDAATFSGSKSSDDLIIGAPGSVLSVANNWSGGSGLPSNTPQINPAQSSVSVGAVYVYTSSSSSTESGLSATASYIYSGTNATTPSANGAAQSLFAGSALASGDWNGDKILDLAIAAPGANQSNGAVYVLSGALAQALTTSQSLNQVSNLTLNGGLPLGQAGAVVAAAGDVNDDDYEDLLITAPLGANAVGQGYVVFGESDLLGSASINVMTLSPIASDSKSTFLLNGNFPYQLTGQAAAPIGDINEDGIDDLMITAPNAEQIYAVYGHPWLADDGSVKLADISGDNGFVTDGNQYTLALGPEIYNLPNFPAAPPSLITYNSTLYLAYVDQYDEFQKGGLIFITTSSDAGRTWTNAVQLPSSALTTTSPSICFYKGVLYLAYATPDDAGFVNICYSADNGMTWSQPDPIQLALTSSGVSLVEYQGQLMLFSAQPVPGAIIQVYIYTDTPKDSNSWSDAVATGADTSQVPISVVAMGGALYIAYQDNAGNNTIIQTTNTDLTSLTWSDAVTVTTGSTSPGAPPAISTDQRQLYLSSVDANGAISYATSGNGTTWSTSITVENQSSFPVQTVVPTVLDSVLYLAYINTTPTPDFVGPLYVTAVNTDQPLFGTGYNVGVLGDVNGDGFADVLAGGSAFGAIINFGASTQDLLDAAAGSNDMLITLAPDSSGNYGSIATILATGDFNGDGLADFGVVDLLETFYLVLGDPSLDSLPSQVLILDASSSSRPTLSNVSSAAAVGDVNGDGFDDLLLTVGTQQQIITGNSAGTLGDSQSFAGDQNTVFAGIGDVNGDGYSDIGAGSPGSNQVSPFSPSANGAATLYLVNASATGLKPISLNPPEAGISALPPTPLNNSAWLDTIYPSQQTKFNAAPSFAVMNNSLYMAYTGVSNSTNNGSLYLQRSFDGFNWSSPTNFQSTLGQASTGYSLSVLNDTLYAAYLSPSAELMIAYSSSSGDSLGVQFPSSQIFSSGSYASYVTPATVVFGDTLYVFFATGNEYESNLGYFTYSNGNWSSKPTNVPIPTATSTTSYNAYLPLGSAIGATADDEAIYLSYATGNGSSSSPSLTFASLDISTSQWTFSTIAEAPTRGSGLLSVGDTLYNFFLPQSAEISVITSTDQGTKWSASSQVQAASGQYWLTSANPTYFQESIFLAYGAQTSKGYNTDVSYAVSNPIFETNLTQQFGDQLVDIGDFNGDGIGDYGVLAPGFYSTTGIFVNTSTTNAFSDNVFENNRGAALVYYGTSDGLPASPKPDLVLGSPPPNASTRAALNQVLQFSQLAAAGDVNGDGYDDLILASPDSALDSNNTPDGLAFVVFGGDTDLWGDKYSATNPFNLGIVTTSIDQLVVEFSKPLSTSSVPPISAFSVASGLDQVSVKSVSVATNSVTLNLNQNVDLSGFVSVSYTPPSSGGLLYASANTPQVSAFTASNDTSINTSPAITLSYDTTQVGQGQYGFQITGLPNSQSGISLAGGGDVNGDGFDDFVIGAPGNDDNLVYTLFGSDFNQTVNQNGTIGEDVMVGSPTGESFVAGQGDDFIVTNGGVDVAYAGPGDDQVIVSDVFFRRLDGGTGTDTLFFYGYNDQDWDLTTLAPGTRLRNFEVLVTENYGANTLTLNSLAVTQLAPNNTVVVFIDDSDSLVLSKDFNPGSGITPPVVYQHNRNFTVYQSSVSAARVLVNQPSSSKQVSFDAPTTLSPAPIWPTAAAPVAPAAAVVSAALASVPLPVGAGGAISSQAQPSTTTSPDSGVPTQVYVSNPVVSEQDGRADFTITRTGDLNQYVWLDYYTKDGDAKAGDRYIPVAGELIFAPGETTKTVAVPIPNNGKYVGPRQFSLAVLVEGESTDPSAVPVRWQAAIASPKEQIRGWSLTTDEAGERSLSFDVTSSHSANRIVSLDLELQGTVLLQIWNPSTQRFQAIPFDATNGIAQFVDVNADSIADLYRLKFQDGGPFDGDGSVNGLVDLDFDLVRLQTTVVPIAGGVIQGTNANNYINAQNSTGTTRLEGLDGDDVLIGSPQRDVLVGGNGNDNLFGGAGVDQLYGDAGDDLLDGGAGMNFLYGGPGADNFVLRAGQGPQRVMDFNADAGDRFVLENLGFNQLSFQGNQIKFAAETLAIVVDQAGRPVTSFASHPAWFSTVQVI